MNKITAILIDPVQKVVAPIEYDLDGDPVEQINGIIESRTYTVANINDHGDGIFLDDEGLFVENPDFFHYIGAHQPFAGKGLVLGCNMETGETTESQISISQVRAMVKFP